MSDAINDTISDDREELAGYVETWRVAVADLVALTRSLEEEQGDLPTDLAGWDVRDNVAHIAHLETVMSGGAHDDIEVETLPHMRGAVGHFTEQGVVARRGRTLGQIADELEQVSATRHAQLVADPPTNAGAPADRTMGGMPSDYRALLGNRPFDVWMHEQDVRRAVDRPGGYDTRPAAHSLRWASAALPRVLAKKVGLEAGHSVLLRITGVRDLGYVGGDDGRVRPERDLTDPDVTLTMDPESYVVLVAGRRGPEAAQVMVEGDLELGQRVLASLALTP